MCRKKLTSDESELSVGSSLKSTLNEVCLPPDQPGKPEIIGMTHNSLQLKWSKPKHGSDIVQSYTISYCCSVDNPPYQWSRQTCSEEYAMLTKLIPGSVYWFKVFANSRASPSPASEVSEVRLPPDQPGKPVASDTTYNSVRLKWTKPKHGAETVQAYSISCQAVDNQCYSINTTSNHEHVTVTNLTPKTVYTFKIRAVSSAGHGPESELGNPIETTLPPPGKPHASNVTHNRLQLNWEKPSHGADSVQFYTVSYCTGNYSQDQWNTKRTPVAVESIQLGSLLPKTVYYFKVRAESATGPSPYSELSDPIETVSPISQPGNPIATKVTHDSITLKWKKPECGSDDVKHYILDYCALHQQDRWLTYKGIGPQASVCLTGLQPKTIYIFKVRAESNVASSIDSKFSCFETSQLPPEIQTQPISAPGKPIATFVTHKSIMLQWDKPKFGANTVKQYHLMYRCIDFPKDNWFPLRSYGSEEKAELSRRVDPNSVYFFKVRAETSSGFSPESEVSDPIKTKLNPPPGTPSASNITYKGFQLNWNKPPYDDIQHYVISYQMTDEPPDKWHTLKADGSKENTYFSAAEEKFYVFKVAAMTASGVTSDSELSDPIETKTVPWGVKVFKDLTPLPHTNPPTCLLPTHCVMKRKEVYKVHVGVLDKPRAKTKSGVATKCSCHKISQAGVHHKVLMVVGATGAGKTTLINGMANYILGVQWDDDFRFKLIDEPHSLSCAYSQTACITAYTFYKEKGSLLPYTLTVIDTPGFGDTAGIDRDKKIIEQIKELFSISGDEGIDQLHGIGFVTQAPLARLTPTQRYVFDAILSVFSKDVADNIFLMITFADGLKPPVLDAVQAAGVPNKAFFKFNNSALFGSKSADDEFDRMFWKMGTKNFYEFFKQLSSTQGQSLQLSREVNQERATLEVAVQGLQSQIKAGLLNIGELRQAMDMAVLCKIEQVRRSVQHLQEIALRPKYLTEVEFIDLIIETEKHECKPRWMNRVKALEGVRQQAVIVTELMKNPQAQQQNVFSIEVEETKSMWQKFLQKIHSDIKTE